MNHPPESATKDIRTFAEWFPAERQDALLQVLWTAFAEQVERKLRLQLKKMCKDLGTTLARPTDVVTFRADLVVQETINELHKETTALQTYLATIAPEKKEKVKRV